MRNSNAGLKPPPSSPWRRRLSTAAMVGARSMSENLFPLAAVYVAQNPDPSATVTRTIVAALRLAISGLIHRFQILARAFSEQGLSDQLYIHLLAGAIRGVFVLPHRQHAHRGSDPALPRLLRTTRAALSEFEEARTSVLTGRPV